MRCSVIVSWPLPITVCSLIPPLWTPSTRHSFSVLFLILLINIISLKKIFVMHVMFFAYLSQLLSFTLMMCLCICAGFAVFSLHVAWICKINNNNCVFVLLSRFYCICRLCIGFLCIGTAWCASTRCLSQVSFTCCDFNRLLIHSGVVPIQQVAACW